MVIILRGLLLIGVFLVSCATSPELYAPVDKAVEKDDFLGGIETIDKLKNKLYPEKNTVLFYLDKGLLEHYAGNHEKSSFNLEKAERLIEEAYTKSISLEIGTYILNDNVREYPGEDYEDIYINVFNALNYQKMGETDEALVEIRKINLKLRELDRKYSAMIEKARNYAQKNGGYSGKPPEKFTFFDSALARYLAGIFWRGKGRLDDARIDLDAMKEARKLAPNVYPFPPPSTLDGEYSVPKDMARFNVIAFTGLSPLKTEEITYAPMPFIWPNNSTKISLPVLRPRRGKIDHIEVSIGGEKIKLELIEDIGKVIEETFKARQALIYTKTIVRTIIKVSSSAVASAALEKEYGGGWGLLAGIAGRVIVEGTESADTRGTRYLPRYVYAGGLNLLPGEYEVTLNYYSGGHLVKTSLQKTVIMKEQLNLLETICLQ